MSQSTLGRVNSVSRREFLAIAISMGASAGWAAQKPSKSHVRWQERRDLYPEGVASGDPDGSSVLLWTRRPFAGRSRSSLRVEVSEDPNFERVVAIARTTIYAEADWTSRVLVGNLRPATVYWYRFTDKSGLGSRIGRTITAPPDDDPRPVNFAVVCCQNINLGAQNAYRRMIFEDEQVGADKQLGFVLHLGDFIYDIVCYPEFFPNGIWGRTPRDLIRYPQGEKIANFHIPASLEDYREIYRAYLRDPDIQDARARWPFVPIWDNHEFSAAGWQSFQRWQKQNRPSASRKVAANQAWFEFQPARVRKSSGPSLEKFDPPTVSNEPILSFDSHGLGQEPNNLAAIGSLTAYRTLRWGRHVELIITDQRSYRSQPGGMSDYPEAAALKRAEFPNCFPQEAMEILDAGRTYASGNAPEYISDSHSTIPNFRRTAPPQTLLGATQKAWFLDRLKRSTATWKIWGNTTGTLDRRVDLQNLPEGLTVPWQGSGYAVYEDGDHASAYSERTEIYSLVRNEKISGFVTVAGDRHSFWAGLAAPTLPPAPFDPVGIAFIVTSLSMPNSADLLAPFVPSDHPLRSLYLLQNRDSSQPQPSVNILLRHGVRACLEYIRTGDMESARRFSNPHLAPHLKFLDFATNGFARVSARSDCLECEFVSIARPLVTASARDGGPVEYRVLHRSKLWSPGGIPTLEQIVTAGNPALSL